MVAILCGMMVPPILVGVFLASFMEDEGLELLNSGDVTHFHIQTGTFTSIDLSLCSNSFLDFIWRVLPDLHVR